MIVRDDTLVHDEEYIAARIWCRHVGNCTSSIKRMYERNWIRHQSQLSCPRARISGQTSPEVKSNQLGDIRQQKTIELDLNGHRGYLVIAVAAGRPLTRIIKCPSNKLGQTSCQTSNVDDSTRQSLSMAAEGPGVLRGRQLLRTQYTRGYL
jgi:hypothetical protein